MNLTPENRLLLYCAQVQHLDERMPLIQDILASPVNWEEILESAFSKGIAPLLYYNLKNVQNGALVPGEVMEELKEEYLMNTARNIYLYRELQRILRAFAEKGIAVMLLKGAALIGTVYRDIGLRIMSDIDLLVRPEDLSIAKEIMYGLDYAPQQQVDTEEWYAKNHYHLPPFFNKEKSIIVEIHLHITKEFGCMDIDKWWERAIPADLKDASALVPSPDDMLIHLCIHLFHHNYDDASTLRGLCDIAETLIYYRRKMDWTLFQEETARHQVFTPVYYTLYLVNKYMYGDFNLPLWLEVKCAGLKFASSLEQKVFAAKDADPVPVPLIKFLTAGFSKKFSMIFEGVFPSRYTMLKRYPMQPGSIRLYLHYALRPFVLSVKYGKSMIRLLRLNLLQKG